jgi:hypothetical protein
LEECSDVSDDMRAISYYTGLNPAFRKKPVLCLTDIVVPVIKTYQMQCKKTLHTGKPQREIVKAVSDINDRQ